jgi:tRNA dimethylallyltransferase
LAWQKIKSLWRKGKLPILVGGTGFYIKGIVDGVATRDIPRNPKIRAELEGWSAEKLFEYLAQIDSERAGSMNRSDKKNPRRLVRAIEVAIYRKENPSWRPPDHEKTNHLFIGLKAPLETLDKKIDLRVKERLEQGLEKEIKRLLAKGYTWEKSALGDTLAYQEWEPFFKGKKSKKEIIDRWKIDEHQYARKQMTWFKKNKGINWFDINKKGWENRVEDLIRKWYSKNNAQQD